MYYTFLPVEIAFIPFQYNDFLYFSLYARGAWQLELPSNLFWTNMFSPENNRFYGAIGTRLFFSSSTTNKLHYSMYSSLFFEYTTLNELTIGITLDAVILGAVVVVGAAIGILKGKYDNIEKERTNQPNYIP